MRERKWDVGWHAWDRIGEEVWLEASAAPTVGVWHGTRGAHKARGRCYARNGFAMHGTAPAPLSRPRGMMQLWGATPCSLAVPGPGRRFRGVPRLGWSRVGAHTKRTCGLGRDPLSDLRSGQGFLPEHKKKARLTAAQTSHLGCACAGTPAAAANYTSECCGRDWWLPRPGLGPRRGTKPRWPQPASS